mmetsp:Transcript_9453/g.19204  ORF Transcript_9453/g.19204 Transcript_9453/m.19204 type:complete len:172 (+) Transcript_9453:1960-2475(+)
MSAVPAAYSTGTGILTGAIVYKRKKEVKEVEKTFEPDSYNTENRIAGVSADMSAEAQCLITRFDIRIKKCKENDPTKSELRKHKKVLNQIKHARTDDPERQKRQKQDPNPFYTDGPKKDPEGDETRAWEDYKKAKSYLDADDAADDTHAHAHAHAPRCEAMNANINRDVKI